MYRSAEDFLNELAEIYDEHLTHVDEVEMYDRPVPGDEAVVESAFKLDSRLHTATRALFDRYELWMRIVVAHLERGESDRSQDFEELSRNLGTWFLFDRSATGVPVNHDTLKGVYRRESAQIILALVSIISDHADKFSFGSTARITYLDLDIRMSRVSDRYNVIADSTLGSAVGEFIPPRDDRDLENFILRHCNPRSSTRTRRAIPQAVTPFSEFGGALFDALIQGDIKDIYTAVRSHAKANGTGFRIRLRQTNVPELMRIPWEFLFDGAGFICLEPRSALVRHLDKRIAPPPLVMRLPLRILVTISSPKDLPPLEVEHEAERLRLSLGPYIEMGLVDLTVIRDGRIRSVQRTLEAGQRSGRPWHVWHFIGHGIFDDKEQAGYLAFESEFGKRLVSGFEMATLFRDYDALRLVVMNACDTAASDGVDAVSGVAGAIVDGGVSTVIAMQFPVSDSAAVAFAGKFYSSIADGASIDAALTEARRVIFFEPNFGEWATPVAFTRAMGTEVFDILSNE